MKITKNLGLITLASFFFFYAYHSYLILPIQIIELGGGEHDVGLIMSVAGASTIFFTPISGMLGDSYNKKKLLLIGAFGLAFSNYLFIHFDSLYYSYIFLRFLQGCSFSFFFVSAGTFVSETIDLKNQAQALGFFGVFAIANHAIAPTLSTYIVSEYSYQIFFLTTSFAALICFIVLTFLEDSKSVIVQGKKSSITAFIRILKNKKIFLIFCIMFLVGGAFVTCLNFNAIYANENMIKPVTLFFISYTSTALVMRIFFGWIPDKIGRIQTCYPGLIGFGISIGMLSFSNTFILIIISGSIFGLCHALVYPSLYSLVLSFSEDGNKTKSFSLCSLSFTFGGMIFSSIYGFIAEIFSFRVMFLSCSIIVTMCFYFLIRKLKYILKVS